MRRLSAIFAGVQDPGRQSNVQSPRKAEPATTQRNPHNRGTARDNTEDPAKHPNHQGAQAARHTADGARQDS